MELRRRHSGATAATYPSRSRILASDALPLPIRHTNRLFSALFIFSVVFLMRRWRQKIRSSSPLHILAFSEILAIFGLLASLIYLFSFFGITFIQSIISSNEEEVDFASDRKLSVCSLPENPKLVIETLPESDDEIVELVVLGRIPSYLLESKLGDCDRAVRIRNKALQKITGRGLEGLPVNGFDYNSILGQCCEMPIGYVQLPVGVAGPLILDGIEYYVPMATTEGCLVASTNRGCKAIAESGGAHSVVLRDGMSRAPAIRLPSARRAAELKAYVENPANFETISLVFNRSSRFGRLQGVKCALAGRNLYMRFTCSTGDAMGMNMVSKGVQNVLDFLLTDFLDMDVISISGSDSHL